MKKSAVIILMVALFGSSAFASGSSCSMRAKGTLFSDSGSSSTSTTSTGTKGQR